MSDPYLMQFWTKAGNLVLTGALALLTVSCGASTQSLTSDSSQHSDADSIEDSGKRLSGEFVLSDVEDAYRSKGAQAQSQSVLFFDESGNFKRQEKSRIEEGAYLIGAKSELVIYIEKVNGEPLTAAVVERYLIIDQRGDSITLQCNPSKSLVLKRR